MTFQGWPEDATEFYEGLEADNTRTCWTAHKAVYERSVLAPDDRAAGRARAGIRASQDLPPVPDVRFSKDKSPYRTEIGAAIGDGYIRLSAPGLAAGSGGSSCCAARA